MTFSDWGIKATIYNLLEEKQLIMKNPKSADKAFAFSNNKKFLAIAEKRNGKDFIGIYYCENWQLMNVRPLISPKFELFCSTSR